MIRASHLLVSLLPLLALAEAPKPALQAPESDPYAALAQTRAQVALKEAGNVHGAAALLRLHALKDDLEALGPLARTDASVAAATHEPLIRDLARELQMEVELSRGDLTAAKTLRDRLGFLHDFYVVGGFDNEGRAGCARDFGPEASINGSDSGPGNGPGNGSVASKGSLTPPAQADPLSATYAGVGRDVSWRKLSAQPLDGKVDLAGAIQPPRQTVAYALTYLEAKSAGAVTLSLGASGGHKLWVDGALVSSAEGEHPARPDQARVTVRLRAGLNPVLLKVCHDEGPLAFYLREESGDAHAVLPAKLPAPVSASASASSFKKLPTLATLFAQAVKAHPNDAALLADQAALLAYLRPYDVRERLAAVAAERAASLAPNDVEAQLLTAQLEEDDANIRRGYLEAALKASQEKTPLRARVLLAWARQESAHGHTDRARTLLEQSLESAHPFPAAELELAHVEEELGDTAAADARFEDVYRRAPHLPRAAREAARISRKLERLGEAVDRYRVAVGLRFDDGESRQLLAGALGDMGRVDEALHELSLWSELTPFDPEPFLRLGELAAANRRKDEARKAFEQARTLAPDQPEVYERQGRALLDAGQREDAVRAFERALVLRPQNPGLREVMRNLKNEHTVYGAEFLLNPLTLLKDALPFGGEDAVLLADITHVRVQVSGQSSRLRQLAVKVLSDRGVDSYRSYPIPYTPSRQEVRILRARVVKPDGSVVESHGETERAMNEPWSAMYYDARAKILTFPALSRGDILELNYQLEDTAQENLLSDYFGDVEYVQGLSSKVRYGYYVDMPAGRPLYLDRASLPKDMKVEQGKTKEDGRILYRFEEKNVPRITPEPGMPGLSEVVTTLHVSTYKNWDGVGRYYWGLVRGQLVKSDELKKVVDTALSGVNRKDTKAVVRALYDFVVTETRYVALEFGIHGYQPYRVDRILARRFGDCKDKASLLHTLLEEAGVDSKLVLLRMRHLGALPETPASLAAFNHAIVYVPALDAYLDGTAEFHGSRELPSPDHLADVLIVEPDGNSRYVVTPDARAEDNVTSVKLDVALRPEGTATVVGESKVAGLSAPEYRRSYRTAATRKATFEQGWAQVYPGLHVEDVSLSDLSKLEEDVSLHYKMSVPRYAEVLPDGLRFYPYGTGRPYTQTFAPLVERKFDLLVDHPWVNRFQVDYTLPPGLEPEALPPVASEQSPFGSYRLVVKREGQKLHCEGEVSFSVSRVKAKDYPAFRAFLGRMDQTLSRKLTLRRAGTQAQRSPERGAQPGMKLSW